MFPLKIGGVALGSSIAAFCNCLLLHQGLRKRIGHIPWEDTLPQFLKVLVVSIAVGITARYLWEVLAFSKYANMGIVAAASVVIFIAGGFMLRLKQVIYIKEKLFRNEGA